MALSNQVCVCIFVVLLCGSKTAAFPDFMEENGFNINGSNVCKYPASKTSSINLTQAITYRESYTTVCVDFHKWWYGIFLPKRYRFCTKYRNATKLVERVVPRTVHGYSLHCCHGWKKINNSDTECSKPICFYGCKHGKCVAGDTCDCDPGWRGFACSQDINECNKKNGGCQQVCRNTAGSHVCLCRRGYTPDANNIAKCLDINECQAPRPRCHCSDPQCNVTCVNTIGSFKCVCPKGYRLNGLNTCTDLDECLSSITNNCPHKCVNTPGSFRCTCFKGFTYRMKSGSCQDLNECADNNGGCEHRCLNAYGSYRCRCNRGYRLQPDRKKCRPFKVIIP